MPSLINICLSSPGTGLLVPVQPSSECVLPPSMVLRRSRGWGSYRHWRALPHQTAWCVDTGGAHPLQECHDLLGKLCQVWVSYPWYHKCLCLCFAGNRIWPYHKNGKILDCLSAEPTAVCLIIGNWLLIVARGISIWMHEHYDNTCTSTLVESYIKFINNGDLNW